MSNPRWGGTESEHKFNMLTVPQVLAMKKPEYLVDGILIEDSFAAYYGPPDSAKSFAVLGTALSIASGTNWLSRKVQRGGAIYVTGGEAVFGYNARIAAWKESNPSACLDNFRLVPDAIDITNLTDVDNLIHSIKQSGVVSPKIIVLDTLARCFGSGDENNASDMGYFVRGVDLLLRQFPGCAVVVIHHTGKAESQGLRGSSALLGALNTSIQMGLKNHRDITISCQKQKDDERFSNISAQLKVIELNAGNGATSCILVPSNDNREAAAADQDEPVFKSPNARQAYDVLKNMGASGASFTDWKSLCGLNDSTFKRVRLQLQTAGHIEKVGGKYVVSEFFGLAKTLHGTLDPGVDPED